MAAKLFVTGADALGDDLKMARLATIMAATPMSVEKINKQVTGDLIMVYVGGWVGGRGGSDTPQCVFRGSSRNT